MSDITYPPLDLARQDYYHLIHNLARGLPPPLNDTPEALLARNQTAIAEIAAMLPVNANEAAFAAQCVAARAQAEDVMRLIRVHAGDLQAVIKLNAQYVAMSRTSFAAHGHLLRAQAVRHKREANERTLNTDEWTQHIAASSLQQALDRGPLPGTLAAEQSAPAQAAEAPPALADQRPLLADLPAAAPAPARDEGSPAPALSREEHPALAIPPEARPSATAAVPPAAPRRPGRSMTPADADEPPRNLPAEAEHYAIVYPRRAREIRHHRGLPPDCSFGPPDDDLVNAIVTGTSPALHALDGANVATA
jgi:hypothetical protein